MVTKKTSKNAPLDYPLLIITGCLLVYGLIVLYSASTVQSFNRFGNTTHYIVHQTLFGALLGIAAMVICSLIDYHVWTKNLPILLVLTLVSLVLVKVPGIGASANGASRWLSFGPLSFQPSELAKLVIIFYLAAWTDKKRAQLNDFYFGLLPSLMIVLLFAAFILWQPDFGTMLVVIGIAAIMLFTAGINWKYLFYSTVSGFLLLYGFIKIEPYRARRLTSFLSPDSDPQGVSYQIKQALLAIGAGGWWGYGYGLSRQKYNYLPEALSDSIFAIVGEELGFIRILILLGLFLLFTLRGIHIAKRAPDMLGKMLAIGITGWITFQTLINIGAIVNLLPLTGIPLPFFSYGSTSLIITLGAIGILLNIGRQANTTISAR